MSGGVFTCQFGCAIYRFVMAITLQRKKMFRGDKLRGMEVFWEDVSADETKADSPAWNAEVLSETERLVKEGKAKFLDWDEAKVLLRSKVMKLA